MAQQQQVHKATTESAEESVTESAAADQTKGAKLKSDIDSILDEIDGVLETNAADFVESYVQAGGE
jgi:prokaryotic ubiquitin-like protein Pup